MLEGVRFSPEQKHRELLENVIEFGLNQSQYLQEIQERDLWTKGSSFTILIIIVSHYHDTIHERI